MSTYIHLNPVRAGLVKPGRESLKRYRWSSYPAYLNRSGKRPPWLRVDRVMESLGLGPGQAKGYEAYIEGRVLELGIKAGRKDLEAQWKVLRRGWYVGGESFLEKLEKFLGPVVKARRVESFSGGAKARHDELAAEQALARGMKVFGLRHGQLEQLPKAAPEKIALAWWVRQRTTVPLRWVTERLGMGHLNSTHRTHTDRQIVRRHRAFKRIEAVPCVRKMEGRQCPLEHRTIPGRLATAVSAPVNRP